jgi:tRNA-Thr(GGU) m(6)t(6)A37 methyltransferase TsaA
MNWGLREVSAVSDSLLLRPLGVVRSSLKDRALAPRQGDEGAPEASIEIDEAFLPALLGVGAGDDLIVVTWFHQANRDILRVHPRGDVSNPLSGVFATRSPDRPNPLGLHRVTVRRIEGRTIVVAPLEAIDGTPVVDLKPVLERVNDA